MIKSLSSRGRVAAAAVAAIVACGAATAVPSSAQAAATWSYYQLDFDSCFDAATLDANYNRYTEQIWYDIDNDCKWDTRVWNTVGDEAFLESMTFDMNEDGRWEAWLADTDGRAGFDYVYFDHNGDGYYDDGRWLTQSVSLGTIGGTPTLTAVGQVYNLWQGAILPGTCWYAPLGQTC